MFNKVKLQFNFTRISQKSHGYKSSNTDLNTSHVFGSLKKLDEFHLGIDNRSSFESFSFQLFLRGGGGI